MTDLEPSRRNLIAGVAAAGAAVPILAACGSGSTTGAVTAPGGTSTTTAAGGGSSSSGGGGGGIPTSEIPVGGGKIFASEQIVITQPTAGEFKAFSAICTHQGCLVNQVANGTIDCPCHGSMFSIKDGSVAAGFAPAPLPEMKVAVSGNTLTVT